MLTDSFKNDSAERDAGTDATRILLVDDHPMIREGTKVTLEKQRGFTVVGEVGDGTTVVAAVQQTQPDIVVLDHVLPGTTGMEVAEEMAQKTPEARIIMMSMYSDEAYVGRALTLGVRGYVAKSAASRELVAAIRAVMAGERYLSPPNDTASIEQYMERAKSAKFDLYKTLTDREKEVGDLIVEGFSSKRIAEKLCISERTVETHRSHIKKKLGARSTAEMVRLIIEHRGNHGDS